ncbi:hypothetical protein P3X46_011277 [Hevea brasiliensis]|uniref:PWWP domain-containing protein n=1 Tax=Hevea brasiliensis TaxID=3981 RepID=A0ABQ9MJD8_HEVBR|nr:uncharacterized protein LOC110634609 [Hevea brasiliensis]KAJ9179495.1 hypothetical protein P3X46_011277 [Hevea brasiliensis]
MKMAKSPMELRRGEIVWARVVYPKKWWPGLLLSVDALGVAVSFFDSGENPRYFLETEVCSFQENFETLIGTVNNCCKGEELVDAALKLLSKRVTSSLKCPCYFRPPLQSNALSRRSKRRRREDLFRSDAVLGFVLGLAVSPFVGVSDFVYAVTVSAQLNVFRNYLVSKQKLFLQPEAMRHHHERDDFSYLSSSRTLGACSGAEKSDASELEFEPMSDDQPNSGSWIQTEQARLQSLHEMLVKLRSLALDTNYMRGEFLNTVKQKILMFRNCAYQTILNIGTEKCCFRGNEIQSSHPCCKKSQPSVKDDENECWGISTCHKSNLACPINFLGLKRHFNYPVDSDFCFKLRKTMTLFSINGAEADIQKSKAGHNAFMLDALISQPALSDLYLKFCNTMPFSFLIGMDAYLQINRSRCEASTSGAFFSGSQLEVVIIDDASSRTRNYLPSSHATNQMQKEPSSDDETSVENNRQIRTNAAFRDSSMDAKGETSVEINRQISTDAVFRDSSIDDDGTSVETNRQLSVNVALRDSSMDETSVETNRQVCTDATFRDCSMDNKKLHPLVTSHVSFKPQAAQQSTHDTIGNYQSLYMKFPKDFSLPSKKDLIRKFSRFGEVDSFRTKIYTRMGSALVVFLHQPDAVAAYQYAKRKKNIFGEPNILYWLDPYEKKTRLSKYVVPLPNIKSCLKKSDLHGREGKKCSKRVRFLMET